ncbi:DNA ligase [Ideonella livida]|uniref:DNA ligase n=1 Tax=Ideonella livida TaxID=2707176 RepID=A0A7C9PER0_9BURK|nr:DNA ligase [Ideonella livida]NDY89935.1 DNA ligase [Ideonella livida]
MTCYRRPPGATNPFTPCNRRDCLGRLAAWAGLGAGAQAGAQPSAPPGLSLASTWADGADPRDWWVSEKLDGVRAFWDGQRLRLRGGGEVAAPAAWLARLPPVALDGELWGGRGRFDLLSGQVRQQAADPAAWSQVLYRVFEAPGQPGGFTQRLEALRRWLPEAPAHDPVADGWPVALLGQRRVADAAALRAWRDQVVAQGGEGLVLHRADALYQAGRLATLAKYKPVEDDEARVLAHEPGQGRLAGRVGALRVQDGQGRVFRLGSGLTDRQREDPPPVGSWVTYAYRGRTPSGLPRFPTFVRERPAGW